MSAPSNGDRPPRIEFSAPSRKKARAAPKPLRDIGVEQFKKPGGTLVGKGHVIQGSAFDTLGKKKKQIQKRHKDKVEVAQDEVDKKRKAARKTAVGDEDDLDGEAGANKETNDPTDAPEARNDTPGKGFTATDMDESLWGEQDEPQEPKQEANNKVLQDLRPNVVRSTPTSRILKAKAGAWGASKLIKPAKETVNVATYTAAEWADSTARAAVAAKTKW
jgi:hypothetical protein